MGYYSIYKIFKDIIKTLFGRRFFKFMLIFIIVTIILFIFNEKGVFAVDENYLYNINNRTGETLDVSNLQQYYYWLVCTYSPRLQYYCYQYICCDEEFSYNTSNNRFYIPNGSHYTFASGVTYQSYTSIQNSINSLNLSQTGNNNYYIELSTAYATGYNSISLDSVIYSNNFDIKNQNNEIQYPSTILPSFVSPQFYNKDNFIDFSDDSLVIYPNDFGITDTLYLHMLTVDSTITDDNNTIYYYGQRIFALNNNSDYLGVIDGVYYYNIPRSIFSLLANQKYIFFLSDNDERIDNSIFLYDYSNDFDGFVLEPTSEQLSIANSINDNLNNIDGFLKDDNISGDTNNNIEDTLQFDTSNDATNFVTGFFSNISDLFVSLSDYDLNELTVIDLPIPFTNSVLTLRSDLLSSHLDINLIQIITLFWYFIFGMYYIKFMISISKSITTGDAIVGTVKVPEVITDDVL